MAWAAAHSAAFLASGGDFWTRMARTRLGSEVPLARAVSMAMNWVAWGEGSLPFRWTTP